MGASIYCPKCGSYHEQTTGGCPQPTTKFYPNEYLQDNPFVNPVISRLDEIIKLLKQLLEKNNK